MLLCTASVVLCRSFFKRITYDRCHVPSITYDGMSRFGIFGITKNYPEHLKELAEMLFKMTNGQDQRLIFVCSEHCDTSKDLRSQLTHDLPEKLKEMTHSTRDCRTYDKHTNSKVSWVSSDWRLEKSNDWCLACEWCSDSSQASPVCVLLLSESTLCDWLCEGQITAGALALSIHYLPQPLIDIVVQSLTIRKSRRSWLSKTNVVSN